MQHRVTAAWPITSALSTNRFFISVLSVAEFKPCCSPACRSGPGPGAALCAADSEIQLQATEPVVLCGCVEIWGGCVSE